MPRVIQIDPDHSKMFGGCLAIVSEEKPWGVQAYIRVPGEDGGDAYVRLKHGSFEEIGQAVWAHAESSEEA